MRNGLRGIILQVTGVVIGGFILAILVRECKDVKATHDAVLRLEAKEKK